MIKLSKKKKSKKKDNLLDEHDVFGEFAFIAGFTENGAPYGILNENWEEESKNKNKERISDEDLPF
jgi:hypothetical protein